MDAMVTRIIEIEKQCAAAVEQAEQASARRIEEHKRALEERKALQREQILSTENSRRIQTIAEAKRKSEADSAALLHDRKRLFQDSSLNKVIREDILSILLEG